MKFDEIEEINHLVRNGISKIQGCLCKIQKVFGDTEQILMELNKALKEYEDNGSKQDKDKE